MPRYASESDLLPRTRTTRYATPDELEPAAETPEYGWMDRAVSTGLRVVPALGGAAAGTLAGLAGTGGVAAPYLGIAGGAAGGGLGEWLAQKYEQSRGLREDTNLGSVAVEAGLGAIPLGKSATLLRAGAKGAGMGIAGAVGHGYAEEGEMPDLQTLLFSGALGGAFGAGAEAIGNRLTRNAPQVADAASDVDFEPMPRPTMHGPDPVEPGGIRYRDKGSGGIVSERVPRYVSEDELMPELDDFGSLSSDAPPLGDLGVDPTRARALDRWLTEQRQTRELDDLARELAPGDMKPARRTLLEDLLLQDERRTMREMYEDNLATINERARPPKPPTPEGGGAPPAAAAPETPRAPIVPNEPANDLLGDVQRDLQPSSDPERGSLLDELLAGSRMAREVTPPPAPPRMRNIYEQLGLKNRSADALLGDVQSDLEPRPVWRGREKSLYDELNVDPETARIMNDDPRSLGDDLDVWINENIRQSGRMVERAGNEPGVGDLVSAAGGRNLPTFEPSTFEPGQSRAQFRTATNTDALARYKQLFSPLQYEAIEDFARRNPRVFATLNFEDQRALRDKGTTITMRGPDDRPLTTIRLGRATENDTVEQWRQTIEHEARHAVETRNKPFRDIIESDRAEKRIPYLQRPSEQRAFGLQDARARRRGAEPWRPGQPPPKDVAPPASPLQDLLSPPKKKSDVTWSRSEAESAVARGYPGTVEEAEAEIIRRTREPHDALAGIREELANDSILRRVAKAGGLNLNDKWLRGELEWLKEARAVDAGRSKAGTLGGVKDVFRRKGGRSLDTLAELLLGGDATGGDLKEAMAEEVRRGRSGRKVQRAAERFRPEDYADPAGIRPGTKWWESPTAAADEAEPAFLREMTPEMVDEPGAAGFISSELASTLGGGLAGGAAGATQGDTPEEHLQNALLGAGAGAAGGYGLTRLLRGRVPTPESTGGTKQQGASPSAQILRAGQLAEQMPPPVPGKPSQMDTSAGRVRFVDDKTGDTPIITLPHEEKPYPAQMRQPKAQREDLGLDHFPEDQRGTLQELADQYGLDSLEAQRRGRMPFALQEALSREYAAHGGKKFAPGTNLPSEGHRHIINTLTSVHQRARELGKKLAEQGGTEAEQLELGKLISAQEVLFYNFVGLRSEAGRATGQYRLQANVLPTNLRVVSDLLNRGTIRKDLADMADLLAATGDDPDGLKTFELFRNRQTRALSERIGSYFSANILSGLQTQERNFLGGAARTVGRLVSKPVIGGLDALESMITGKPRQVFSSEVAHEARGIVAGMDGAIKDALDTMRLGYSRNAMQAGWADVDKLYYPKAEFSGGGKNPLNWVGRGMEGADRFWRSINQSMELHALTYADARRAAERQGLTGSAYDSFVARQIAEARANPSKDLQRRVNKAAERAVYGEDNALASQLNALKKHAPALHYVIPFIKTVANIFKQGIEHTPLGFFMARAKSGDARERAIAQGEAAMGTLAMIPIAYYAATGRMSGSGPRDPAERARLYESGWRPHSVKLPLPAALAQSLGASASPDGDYWVSYALAQPFSIPAAIVANGFEAFDEVSRNASEKTREQAASDIVTQTLARVGKSALDQSFLSGLGSFVEAINDPERAAEGFFGRTAQGFVPMSGALRNVARVLDPVVRQPEGILESFQSNLPGLSQNVPPRVTRFGEPVVRHDSSALVVPETSPVQRDAISDELQRLGVSLAVPTDRMSGVKRQLTRDESLQVRQTRGRTVRALLSAVMGAPGYERLPDVAREELLQRALEEVKGDVNQLLRAAVQLQRPDLMQQVSAPVTAAAQQSYR